MITSAINEKIADQINSELIRLSKENLIIVKPEQKQSKFDKVTAKFLYETYHDGLGTRVTDAQEQVIFSERFIAIDEYYHGFFEYKKPLSDTDIQEHITSKKKKYDVDEFIYDFVSSKLNYIPTILTEQIDKLKNSSNYPCCDSVDIILQDLINHYVTVINSPTKQIGFFLFDLQLNKKLSDLLSMGIVNVLKEVVSLRKNEEVDLTIQNLTEFNSEIINYKLIWLGKQKELVELIVQLQDKKWIAPIPSGRISKASRSICNTFDLTGTKRNPNTNEEKSFEQSLKGELIDGVRNYDLTFGKRYIEKFAEIKLNADIR